MPLVVEHSHDGQFQDAFSQLRDSPVSAVVLVLHNA
jgi:hypothetical protein